MASTASFDVSEARKHFPALEENQVFLDNAGGSQVLGEVTASIKEYLDTTNVQLGATYRIGDLTTRKYNAAYEAGAKYVNASPDDIVLGPSTTQLFRNLSISLIPYLTSSLDSEIIVSKMDHEANIASWVDLAQLLNLKLIWWTPDTSVSTSPQLTPASLKPLLTPNTKLVTCTHTSNILGTITDIAAVASLVHTIPGAMLCVDGVAYAPHRQLDMAALGVDFYSFSWYKCYGPHIAMLYARRESQDAALKSLGHYFKEGKTLEEKLGLAGGSYELVQSLPTVVKYLDSVGWDGLVKHEEKIQGVLLEYLRSRPDVYTIIGEETDDAKKRVPVISFSVKGRGAREFVETVEKKTDLAFRWGHFYSKRLTDEILGLGEEGVVRVSMVHYNTVEEITALVNALDNELANK